MKVLVFTAFDGGVQVTRPVGGIMRRMTGGGGYWDDAEIVARLMGGAPVRGAGGSSPRAGFLRDLIARKAAQGVAEDVAARWVEVMQWGGCSTGEAWAVFRDHDCARKGHSIDLQDDGDLPGDRWFRDAWMRNHNGAVVVDMKAARQTQWARIVDAVEIENKRRARTLFGKPEFKLPRATFEAAIINAVDADELTRIWPDGVPRPVLEPQRIAA